MSANPRVSRTTAEQHRKAVTVFRRNPKLLGQVLHWICGDDTKYFDLSGDRGELTPR